MINRTELLYYLNDLLKPNLFNDYAPNGLQIEGASDIKKIITGVSANQALIDQAIDKNVDTIIVHHGFFWKSEDPCIVGIKKNRISELLKNNINLFAYHLPLDANLEVGNNAEFGRLMGLEKFEVFDLLDSPIGFKGELKEACEHNMMIDFLDGLLIRKPIAIQAHDRLIKKIAWCTGAAEDGIEAAALQGVDAYISGEISERTPAMAKELGISYFSAGHHATERLGVKALGEKLAQEFSAEVEFVDVDNWV